MCAFIRVFNPLYTPGGFVWCDGPIYLVKQPQQKWACDFHDDAPPLSSSSRYWNWSFFHSEKIIRFKKWPQLPGAGRTRAGHHHGSHTATSPEAVLLGKMAYHTKHKSAGSVPPKNRWNKEVIGKKSEGSALKEKFYFSHLQAAWTLPILPTS